MGVPECIAASSQKRSAETTAHTKRSVGAKVEYSLCTVRCIIVLVKLSRYRSCGNFGDESMGMILGRGDADEVGGRHA